MAQMTPKERADRTNALSFETTANLINTAQRMMEEGASAPEAACIVLDAARMTAASFIQTAVFEGTVRCTMPVPQLLHVRLDELLAMETVMFPRRADGSFDPVGQRRN